MPSVTVDREDVVFDGECLRIQPKYTLLGGLAEQGRV